MNSDSILKQDLFGTIEQHKTSEGVFFIRRNTHLAHANIAWLARKLLRREQQALKHLKDLASVPRLLRSSKTQLERSWIDGASMHIAKPTQPIYFREAMRLLRLIHAKNITHNDLAKETNWLVTQSGLPALIDFQLASHSPRRGCWFKMLAHNDIRHLLKHKRSYIPTLLTARECRILAQPSMISQLWGHTYKPIYWFITRNILKWSDREGAGDRKK
ncbi:MAG: serine/threonine protein kinase [Gammaproteobacteria bacterium]|nr:serine/threonine protein kinase [Gammaproteobacteria bacterium]